MLFAKCTNTQNEKVSSPSFSKNYVADTMLYLASSYTFKKYLAKK